MKILIAGGGIGGLTTALTCLDAGLEVEVFEQAPELGEIGAGLQLSSNAMHVLRALGLETEITSRAFEPEALEMRLGRSGKQVFSIPIKAQSAKRYGAPYLHIHRADLLDVLAKALRERAPDALKTGHRVSTYRADSCHIHLDFGDNGSATGDVLIGADGIHSIIRETMQGPDKPRFTGNVAWRVTVPAADIPAGIVPPTACVWTGEKRHAVTYYLRGGELVNFIGIVERDDWRQEDWTEPSDLATLQTDFAGWAAPLQSIIHATSEGYRWALFDRAPLSKWSDGRVSLMGDACHPMLPFLAQGAAMAIEDAFVLADCLKQNMDNPAAALARYEALRKPRTSRVQAAARANMKTFHHGKAAGQLATYGPMWLGARLLPSVVNHRLDWLYGHDVTRAAP